MTYSPHPDAIVKNKKKGGTSPVKTSVVDRILDSVSRVAADTEKKVTEFSKEVEGKLEKKLLEAEEKLLGAEVKSSEEVAFLRTQVESVQTMLSDTSKENILGQMSLKTRLSNLEEELRKVKQSAQNKAGGVVDTVESITLDEFHNALTDIQSDLTMYVEAVEARVEEISSEVDGLVKEKLKDLEEHTLHAASEMIETAIAPLPKSAKLLTGLLIGQLVFDAVAVAYIVLSQFGIL